MVAGGGGPALGAEMGDGRVSEPEGTLKFLESSVPLHGGGTEQRQEGSWNPGSGTKVSLTVTC